MVHSTFTTSSYTAEFAVDMTCDACESKVKQALNPIPGIESVHVDIPSKRVIIESRVQPSTLIKALRSTGLHSALQGQGQLPSAVCVFRENVGVARMIAFTPTHFFLDLSLDSQRLPKGTYTLELKETGDLRSDATLGDTLVTFPETLLLPTSSHLSKDVSDSLSSWVGKGLCLRSVNTNELICGVVARSAGAFQNKKQICACSGKTIWEENVSL